jgi:DNA-3-methyladenine glycosylase I
MIKRCAWVDPNNELYTAYHDREWGVPVHDDRLLFEFLTLEGAQAGLSWFTILSKRPAYRLAFDNFDPEKVAAYDEAKITALLADAGIVRNRLKIRSAIGNAQAFLKVQGEYGSFDNYLWGFVGGKPVQNAYELIAEVPTKTGQSDHLSNDLVRRGFKFVGSTIMYAFMQAVGMVNDHTTDCFRYQEVTKLR